MKHLAFNDPIPLTLGARVTPPCDIRLELGEPDKAVSWVADSRSSSSDRRHEACPKWPVATALEAFLATASPVDLMKYLSGQTREAVLAKTIPFRRYPGPVFLK